jgi:predicted RNase H-like HicB family nuclease
LRSEHEARLAFTAVFLQCEGGYIGFVEEIPGVNAHGRSLEDARRALVELTRVVFDEERRSARDLLAGREALREPFWLPLPPASKEASAQREVQVDPLHQALAAHAQERGLRGVER